MIKVGFIGAGNMGGAIARSAYSTGACQIYVCDKDEEKAQALAGDVSGTVCTAERAVKECDLVFLATKPNILPAVAQQLSEAKCTLVSMAAGVTLERLGELFGKDKSIIRIMPNTPILVGCGVAVYAKNENVDGAKLALFLTVMANAGLVEEIVEEKIDAETAVAGCGPAFVYLFAKAIANGGVLAGLSEAEAIRFASATLKGAAQMLLSDTRTPDELCRAVCSPGGSTIEGVKSLLDNGFEKTVSDAVVASYNKTKTLGK